MPKTFQDAIIAARVLREQFGVNYISVDALCIIQDSEEDWEHESSIMGEIYTNLFCNFAACIGPDLSFASFQSMLLSRYILTLVEQARIVPCKACSRLKIWSTVSLIVEARPYRLEYG